LSAFISGAEMAFFRLGKIAFHMLAHTSYERLMNYGAGEPPLTIVSNEFIVIVAGKKPY
jgi:hypothetical protein